MKIIIALTLLSLSQARFIESECGLVSIDNVRYEKEVLKENINAPYQMAIDYDTNTLFFSFTAGPITSVFLSAYLNLKTFEYNTIPDVVGGFAAAVDKNNQRVYLGGRDGVYEFNVTTHKAKHIDKDGHSIWQMFFKDKLYYTEYPEENVYSFKDGISTLVPELKNTKALLMAVDSQDNWYFKNSSGLYYYKKAGTKTVFLGDYNLNSITVDINGNLYFSTPNGFYKINNIDHIYKLADVDNVYGLVVEGDNNYIYAAKNSIVRLKPTKKTCFSNEKKPNASY